MTNHGWDLSRVRRTRSQETLASVATGVVALGLVSCLLVPSGLWAASDPNPPSTDPPSQAEQAADLPAEVSEAWFEEVKSEIVQSQYNLSPQADGSYAATNLAQRFSAIVKRDTVSVTPLAGSGAPYLLTLSLTSFGRAGSAQEISSGILTATKERVDNPRGLVAEWFLNRASGLEHGFSIASPPDSGLGQAILGIAVGGTLIPRVGDAGQSILFEDSKGGVVLKYGALAVADANGQPLPATLNIVRDLIQIEIDDSFAAYPITVDPLLTTPVWVRTNPGDPPYGLFGYSVAIVPNIAGNPNFPDIIVGAPGFDTNSDSVTGEGEVLVFPGNGTTFSGTPLSISLSTINQPTACVSSAKTGARFGQSMAVGHFFHTVPTDPYDLVVGAPGYDCNGDGTAEGAIFAFKGPLSAGLATYTVFKGSTQSGAEFGAAVANAKDVGPVDGYDDVLVGAPGYYLTSSTSREGAAFLLKGSSTTLTLQWSALGGSLGVAAQGRFGNSVAGVGFAVSSSAQSVLIGAPGFHSATPTLINEGAAYLFTGPLSGSAGTPDWSHFGGQKEGRFGTAVGEGGDFDGDGWSDLLVGEPGRSNGESAEGMVSVYFGSSTGIGPTPWTAESNQRNTRFGSAVTAIDVNGDLIADVAVGAPLYDFDPVHRFEGRVFVYLGSQSLLPSVPSFTINNSQLTNETTEFGLALSTGDFNTDGEGDLLVGGWRADNAGQDDVGRVFLYEGKAGALATAPSWALGDASQTESSFGYRVASAGDVNGDGYGDVIIGAPFFDNLCTSPCSSMTDAGKAYVFYGSQAGLSTNLSAAWVVLGDQAGARLGYSVSTAGDVNGDGYGDIVIGAPLRSDVAEEGFAYLFLGSVAGLPAGASPASAAWAWHPTDSYAHGGWSMASAGDVNNDGLGDVIIGAPGHVGPWSSGHAYLFLGCDGIPTACATSPLGVTPNWSHHGGLAGSFGYSVATAGDVNQDGLSDVVIGDPMYAAPIGPPIDPMPPLPPVTGAAHVYLGDQAAGLQGVPNGSMYGEHGGDQFGFSVAGDGDVDRDGKSDVLVGAPYYSGTSHYQGAAYAYYGAQLSQGEPQSWDWKVTGSAPNELMGYVVASAGDTDPDGYSDVLVSSPNFSTGSSSQVGLAGLYKGSGNGLTGSVADWLVVGAITNGNLSRSLASAGDVNGDGVQDVVVGSDVVAGTAMLYYGNDGVTQPVLARQATSVGSNPVYLLGKTDVSASFRLRVLGRSAGGRGRVQLEYEVKPLGQAFQNDATSKTDFFDTGVAGGNGSVHAFDRLVTGIGIGPRKWRMRIITDNPSFPNSRWYYCRGSGPELNCLTSMP